MYLNVFQKMFLFQDHWKKLVPYWGVARSYPVTLRPRVKMTGCTWCFGSEKVLENLFTGEPKHNLYLLYFSNRIMEVTELFPGF